jgi:selenocysteine lyase/cysteine desulfurase
MTSRRAFLHSLAAMSGTAVVVPQLRNDGAERILRAASGLGARSPEDIAEDEDFWGEIQRAFDLDRTMVNFNNGGVCPSPRVVMDALRRYQEHSNQAPAYYMWRHLETEIESVRRDLAREAGCDPEELAITRNASESLENVQLGLPLERGDEVVTTDHDYGRMLTTWEQRERRDGIVVRKLSFKVPARDMASLVRLFEGAITPRTKVLHFCHITNISGQIFPVREICRMARARGIRTIVDGAHAFAHFPYSLHDLECDFYGTSLHKWLLAPVGTGFLYARRELIREVWPLMAAPKEMDDNIRKFEEIGTHPAANHNAIAEALTFHRAIGVERKVARLRYLRDRWMRPLEGRPRVQLHTSFDPAMSGGVANVGIEGIDPAKIADHLWTTRRVFTTPIGHPDCTGIRVTPNIYSTLQEVDLFAEGMEEILVKGVAG